MALSTGSALNDWDGTGQQTLINSSSDLSSGTFSSESSELDNSTTKALLCKLVLSAKDGFSGAWNGKPSISVYMREKDIDGTNDAPVIDDSYREKYVGTFNVDKGETTGAQYLTCMIDMLGVKKCTFYIENNTGKVLEGNIANGWTLKAELLSMVPKA